MQNNLCYVNACGIFDSRNEYQSPVVTPQRCVKRYEADLFISDTGTAFINGTGHKIKKGNLLLVRPGDYRNSKLHFSCKFFHFEVYDESLSSLIDTLPRYIDGDNRALFERYFDKINSYNLRATQVDGLFCRLCVGELMRKLYEHFGSSNKLFEFDDDAALSGALQYIKSHISEPMNAETIAQSCRVSTSSLYNKFRSRTGFTPNEYIISQRILLAKQLLVTTDKPLDFIAQTCGFSSQSYFTYSFKKSTGFSPLKFRNAHKYSL